MSANLTWVTGRGEIVEEGTVNDPKMTGVDQGVPIVLPRPETEPDPQNLPGVPIVPPPLRVEDVEVAEDEDIPNDDGINNPPPPDHAREEPLSDVSFQSDMESSGAASLSTRNSISTGIESENEEIPSSD